MNAEECLNGSKGGDGTILTSFLLLILVVIIIALLFLAIIFVKKETTRAVLIDSGLPIQYWKPRFIKYVPFEENRKLAPSNITRILPKMEKLKGPYGMFGTVYGISIPVIHVAHPIPIKAILKSPAGATKAPAYNHFKNFFGDGVFTADGQAWKAKRTAVMHCLVKGTASSTSEMSQRLEREANRAADIFCCQIQSLKGQQNRPISGHCSDYGGYVVSTNIVPLLQRATIGLIYRYITHTDPEWLLPTKIRDAETNDDKSNEPMKVIGKYESVSNVTSSSEATRRSRSLLDSYLSSIIRIRMIILAQSRSVWFLLPRWCYTLFSSLYRDEESTLGPIREFAKRACKDARPGSPLERLRDLGSLYISNTCPPTKRSQMLSFYHTNITNKNLLDEAITLLFAGQDTSAATLSWTLHLLSLHPKAQERVFKEVRDVLKIINQEFPSRSKDRKIFITRKEIKQLSFLDAVIKESMRLYPVAPFVVRHLVEKVNIPAENNDGIISLPKGSQACLWIYGLHRNPKLWNNPDDFIPERWLDINLKDPGQTNGGYMPFAFGARNCLGQPLARVILRTILAKLVLQYKFKDVRLRNEENSIDLRKEMQAGFTVLPTGGVTLEIYSRIKENQEY